MSVKFTAPNALFLTTFLTALPAKELPPAFPFGSKTTNYKLLANDILTQYDCPFKDAKETTVIGYIKNTFNGVEMLNIHISDIEASGQAINLEEIEADITLAGGGGTCTTLELDSAELDAIKNATDTLNIIVQLCSLRQKVAAYKAKEHQKVLKDRADKKRKRVAGDKLVNADISEDEKQDQSDDEGHSDSDDSDEGTTTAQARGGKKAAGKKAKATPRKKNKAEGPPKLGQGQTNGEKVLTLAQVMNRMVDSDIAESKSSSSAPREGGPLEIKAWDFLFDTTSFLEDSQDLCDYAKTKLKNFGAKGPSDLVLMGKLELFGLAQNLKGVPAKALCKVGAMCSQD
ncbi:hypothetical protein B484DRAFT_431287 [Ochromonadaceae sp. CCMP2298]|nr:hypothetical protein B484DRAFT_431287 [Ochromonadaceae sp. CCMP2298]